MNKLCVSLGHCCGLVTMASAVRGRRNAVLLGNEEPWGGGGEWRRVCFSHWSHSLSRLSPLLFFTNHVTVALTCSHFHLRSHLSPHAAAALPAASPSVTTIG